MSVRLPDDIQGLDQANAELDRLMAQEDQGTKGLKDQGTTDQGTTDHETKDHQTKESATEGQRAGQQEKETQETDPKPETKGPETKGPKDQGTKEQESKEQKKSRYAKAVERQEKSWAELNAQKEALKRERDEFDKARAEHQARLAEQEKEFSPEAYEDAAKKFEEAGKFDLAELAREKAAELKAKGPKDQGAQALDPLEAQRKEWALKAGVDFPELAKTNSALQMRVAQLLKDEPEFKAHPKGIYVAARIADLETRASALPAAQKELETLRAKVKELEQATAPGGPGGAAQLPSEKNWEQKSDTEQYEELVRMAGDMGTLR